MKIHRLLLSGALPVLSPVDALAPAPSAAGYRERPLRFVAPFAPGGATGFQACVESERRRRYRIIGDDMVRID